MHEIFSDEGNIVSEGLWVSRVKELLPDSESDDSEDVISQDVQKFLDEAIKIRIEDSDSVGIFFSGGLDSSYIAAVCKKHDANFTCYNVGFQDGNFKEPEDVLEAEKVSKFLKLSEDEFKSRIFTIKELEPIIRKTIRILKDGNDPNKNIPLANVVNVGVGAVEVAAHSISRQEGIFFSGLGSEEIFAGYDRHKRNPTNKECIEGLFNMYQRDILRDSAISSALKFSFRTPFLDENLIKFALRIPIGYKINEGGSKMILRKAALPILKEHSMRPKRAAQYGSSFDRALSKLASMHGFKFKKDYIGSIV